MSDKNNNESSLNENSQNHNSNAATNQQQDTKKYIQGQFFNEIGEAPDTEASTPTEVNIPISENDSKDIEIVISDADIEVKSHEESTLFDPDFAGVDTVSLNEKNSNSVESCTPQKKEKLNPIFNTLDNPNTFKEHLQKLKETVQLIPHAAILKKLLDQIESIDFKSLAHPKAKLLIKKLSELNSETEEARIIRNELSNLKVKNMVYIVLSIENIVKVAKNNLWNLCKNMGGIYLFNGVYWEELDKEAFQKFLGEAAEKMGVPVFLARYYNFRDQLFKQFLATQYLPTPENNNNTVLINLLNGTFEINKTNTLMRHFNHSDFITYQLPFEYNQNASAPLFQKFLDEVLPNKESQMVLAEYLGYIFIKHGSKRLKVEKALILYGLGANGKSVIFEIVNALLGDANISSYSLQSLTNENGYYRAKLGNKLVNYSSEINSKLESSLFKQIVSGEPVEARLPYGQPFILKQYAKLIFNCNELPKDVEHTNAFFRRFLIIPFNITIPPEKQDKTLHVKIIENELSGVFNWVINGLNRLLMQKGFTHCEEIDQAVENFRNESNSVKMFITENKYERSVSDILLLKNLYIEYRTFCNEDGFKPVNKKNFKNRLVADGVTIERKSIGYVIYLKKGFV